MMNQQKNSWPIVLKILKINCYIKISKKGQWHYLMDGASKFLINHLELSDKPVYAYVECYTEEE